MDNKCKVCGKKIDINMDFCPYCKYPQFILPAEVSEDVLKYEDERLSKYKELWDSKNEKSPSVRGYLVLQNGTTILRIYPVYEGKNVFGQNPDDLPGVFTHRINPLSGNLKNTHFSLEPTETDSDVIAKVMEEKDWQPSNICGKAKEVVLVSSDSFEIDNLRFSYFARKK